MRSFRIPFALWKKCVCVSVCLSACVWAPQTLIYATCIVLMQQIAMSCNTTIPSNNWHSIDVVLDFTGSTNQKYFFEQLSWQMLHLWELSCGLHGQNIPNQRHWKTAGNSLQDFSFETAAPTNTHQWASKRQTCFAGKNMFNPRSVCSVGICLASGHCCWGRHPLSEIATVVESNFNKSQK